MKDNYYSFSLFSKKGERKYLNASERKRFFRATYFLPFEKRLFCLLIYHTGARISEVVELRELQFDFSDKSVIFRTLKQRSEFVYRQVPIPDYLLNSIMVFLNMRRRSENYDPSDDMPVWSFSLSTGYRAVKAVMKLAHITGVKANARGLRHGFAVHAVTRALLTEVQAILGHSDLKTTAIYLQVSGMDKRQWAEKLWEEDQDTIILMAEAGLLSSPTQTISVPSSDTIC